VSKKPFRFSKATRKEALLLNQKIFYNKKFREKIKKDSRKLITELKEILNSVPLKYGKTRNEARAYIMLAESFLESVKAAEKDYKFNDQRGDFFLFKNKNNYVFHSKTLRDGKVRSGNLIFPHGLPKKNSRKAFLHKRVGPPSKIDWVDFGKYHFKKTSFKNGFFHFYGKADKYFIDITEIKASDKRGNKLELRCKLAKEKIKK